jgi:hypothetical protein
MGSGVRRGSTDNRQKEKKIRERYEKINDLRRIIYSSLFSMHHMEKKECCAHQVCCGRKNCTVQILNTRDTRKLPAMNPVLSSSYRYRHSETLRVLRQVADCEQGLEMQ